MLDAAVVPGAEQASIGMKERCPDRDSTLGEADARFVDGDGEHLSMGRQHLCRGIVRGNSCCS